MGGWFKSPHWYGCKNVKYQKKWTINLSATKRSASDGREMIHYAHPCKVMLCLILKWSKSKSEVAHETKFSLKMSYSTHAYLAQLDQHQTHKPVVVSVMSSIPLEATLLFVQKWQICQICVIYEILECIYHIHIHQKCEQNCLWNLKPRGDVTRSSKHGYQWSHKWTCVQQKKILVCLSNTLQRKS